MTLPIEFKTRMESLLMEEANAFLHTYHLPKTSGLRVNTLKADIEDINQIVPFHLLPVPFCPAGFYVDETDQPGKNPLHHAGVYYIQEPSAMFVAEVLDPKPGEKVLDLCAAPGGKATQIAAKMETTGLLSTNDINPKRVKALSENVERLGITNAIVTNETPEKLAAKFESYFDRILVDAPCSGEGMFRKDPEAMEYWSPEHVKECAIWQKDILDHAYKMLRPGGTLVYSTCTFSPEENEEQIAQFVQRFPDMAIEPIEKIGGVSDGVPEWSNSPIPELKNAARLWPHHLKGEGHFVAKLIKRGSAEEIPFRPVKNTTDRRSLKDYKEFEKTYLNKSYSGPLMLMRDQLYLLPEDAPSMEKIKVIRPGLHLGTFKKNRFEPNHALALALSPEDVKHHIVLTLDDQDWKKYLRGETLLTGGNRGWVLVTIEGFSLGWGKEVQGTLKNFYPKGLRIM
ncbi:MAG: RsmF rRNA methyltransferase first C-terminal domain-containing protein [Tuberibacillus sp.]